MSVKKIKIYTISILKLLLLSLCFFSCRDEVELLEPNQITKVSTVVAEEKKVHQDLTSFGSISYSKKNDVAAQVQGTIEFLYAKEGESVKKGQLLARLTNVQLEIQQEQAKNSLNSAESAVFLAETKLQEARLSVESRLLAIEKTELEIKQQQLELVDLEKNLEDSLQLYEIGGVTTAEIESKKLAISAKQATLEILNKELVTSQLGFRESDLIANGIVPAESPQERLEQFVQLNTRTYTAELQAAYSNLFNAEKNLDSMNKLMQELFIKSPSDGVVGAVYFHQGEFVPENEKIFTLMDVSPAHAVFYVQEEDMGGITIGSPVTVELPSCNLCFQTKIAEISPVVDLQTGNLTLKAEVENSKLEVKPGMFVKCIVPKKEQHSLPTIPKTALVSFSNDGDSQVFLVKKSMAVKTNVKIAQEKDGTLWISDGIKPGDIIIDSPSPFLKEGTNVSE
ncbi:MAG: efflux RND transporter periplasmic adaptor subunit [Spirochaetaceae bacterium]|nr:efflux RND transporter periplasmic adaptor subunit [Spirochaetaceae bacterium]